MMVLMLARRVPEQLQTFAERGLGRPLGMQLAGKTLGIIGMGAIGAHSQPQEQHTGCGRNECVLGSCRAPRSHPACSTSMRDGCAL